MILTEIKGYLSARGQATLTDIALHFDASPDAVRGMLQPWIRKGKVRMVRAGAGCGSGCSQCSPESTEIYQWLGDEPDRPPAVPLELCRR